MEGNKYEFRVMAENVQGRGEPLESDKPVTPKPSAGESSLVAINMNKPIRQQLELLIFVSSMYKILKILMYDINISTIHHSFSIPVKIALEFLVVLIWLTQTKTSSKSDGLPHALLVAHLSLAMILNGVVSTLAGGRRSTVLL